MPVQEITTIISTVGFPIACCMACFWYINKSGEQHKQEIDNMSKAINNNTVVMQKLIDKLSEG